MLEEIIKERYRLKGPLQDPVHSPNWFSILAMVIGWVALVAGLIATVVYFGAASDTWGEQHDALIVLGIGSFFAGAITFVICVGIGKTVDHMEVIRKEMERK